MARYQGNKTGDFNMTNQLLNEMYEKHFASHCTKEKFDKFTSSDPRVRLAQFQRFDALKADGMAWLDQDYYINTLLPFLVPSNLLPEHLRGVYSQQHEKGINDLLDALEKFQSITEMAGKDKYFNEETCRKLIDSGSASSIDMKALQAQFQRFDALKADGMAWLDQDYYINTLLPFLVPSHLPAHLRGYSPQHKKGTDDLLDALEKFQSITEMAGKDKYFNEETCRKLIYSGSASSIDMKALQAQFQQFDALKADGMTWLDQDYYINTLLPFLIRSYLPEHLRGYSPQHEKGIKDLLDALEKFQAFADMAGKEKYFKEATCRQFVSSDAILSIDISTLEKQFAQFKALQNEGMAWLDEDYFFNTLLETAPIYGYKKEVEDYLKSLENFKAVTELVGKEEYRTEAICREILKNGEASSFEVPKMEEQLKQFKDFKDQGMTWLDENKFINTLLGLKKLFTKENDEFIRTHPPHYDQKPEEILGALDYFTTVTNQPDMDGYFTEGFCNFVIFNNLSKVKGVVSRYERLDGTIKSEIPLNSFVEGYVTLHAGAYRREANKPENKRNALYSKERIGVFYENALTKYDALLDDVNCHVKKLRRLGQKDRKGYTEKSLISIFKSHHMNSEGIHKQYTKEERDKKLVALGDYTTAKHAINPPKEKLTPAQAIRYGLFVGFIIGLLGCSAILSLSILAMPGVNVGFATAIMTWGAGLFGWPSVAAFTAHQIPVGIGGVLLTGVPSAILFIMIHATKKGRATSPIYQNAKSITHSAQGIASKLGHTLHLTSNNTKTKSVDSGGKHKPVPTTVPSTSVKNNTGSTSIAEI